MTSTNVLTDDAVHQPAAKKKTDRPDLYKDQNVTLIHTVFNERGAKLYLPGFGGKTVTDPVYKRSKGWFVDVLFFGRKEPRTIPCIYLTNKKLSEI